MADPGFKYVAGKPITIDGKVREVGEDVPEAFGWRNPKAWEASRHLKRVSTGEAPKAPEPTPVPVEEPPPPAAAVEPDTEPEADEDADVKHVCPECSREYTTEAGLKRHMGRAHG